MNTNDINFLRYNVVFTIYHPLKSCENATKLVCIQDCYGYIIAKKIKELFAIIDL